MKTLIALLLVAFATDLVAQKDPKPLGSVKEGVYFERNQNRTNVLELKNGRFRRWIDGTRRLGGGGNNRDFKPGEFVSVLRTGEYTTNGGTIQFVTEGTQRRPFITNELTFMEFRGKTSLWSSAAQKFWDQNKGLPFPPVPPGVLQPTDRKPEEILEGK